MQKLNFDGQDLQEVESVCTSCLKNGSTKMLLVNIPHFHEIIVMSFECPHCGEKNTSVQDAATIGAQGCHFLLKVTCKADLQRRIVKSDSALFQIVDVEFEIPAKMQPGQFTTLEGIITQAVANLELLQPQRATEQPEQHAAIEGFLEKMRALLEADEPSFTVILDDPTGNSFIENPHAPQPDPEMTHTPYTRTKEQNMALGLKQQQEDAMAPGNKATAIVNNAAAAQLADRFSESAHDIYEMPAICPSCTTSGTSKMCVTAIPHFKEVIIMAYSCSKCGYKSTEVKSGGEIAPHGTKYTLLVGANEESELDLNRDVLKSDTADATVIVNDVELIHVSTGTLGGMFTTVEGFLSSVRSQLGTVMPFSLGDGASTDDKAKMDEVIAKLDRCIAHGGFTLILDDPASNSYVQDIWVPEPDPQLTVEKYTRNQEQQDDLGLLDMVV